MRKKQKHAVFHLLGSKEDRPSLVFLFIHVEHYGIKEPRSIGVPMAGSLHMPRVASSQGLFRHVPLPHLVSDSHPVP